MRSLQELFELRMQRQREFDRAKALLSTVDEEIQAVTVERMKSLYGALGKQFGTARAQTDEGVTIVADIPKKVEWDSDILMRVAGDMPWDLVQRVFKIKFEIPEKAMKEFVPVLSDEQKTLIDAARTVKYGDMKIKLEVKE